MQHGTLLRNIDELKATGWIFKQNIINATINKWRMHLPAVVYANGLCFKYLLSAVAQLDKLLAKVLEIWTKCAKCVLFESNNDTALNKNAIFWLFFFQVVQKQMFGKTET